MLTQNSRRPASHLHEDLSADHATRRTIVRQAVAENRFQQDRLAVRVPSHANRRQHVCVGRDRALSSRGRKKQSETNEKTNGGFRSKHEGSRSSNYAMNGGVLRRRELSRHTPREQPRKVWDGEPASNKF